ncbi:hypothetical protein ACFXI6_14455 [Streptomyces mirabilis]|uniref:hypothetical protein n=1 Tax=Streptomyces mirabilis TaxID=68239 RepID=UPI0036A930F4
MSAAEELRAAAEKLRTLATEATPGPWRQHDTHLGQYGHTATVLSGEGNDTDLRAWLPSMSQESWDEARNVWNDAAYMAALHPGVGLALADWLDETATEVTAAEGTEYALHPDGGAFASWEAALAVARAVNGSAS